MEGFVDNFDELDEMLNAKHDPHPSFCYIIEIKNNNPITLQNIEVGNAIKNLQKENFGLPPNVTANCKIGINDEQTHFSYENYLQETLAAPFQVGLIYIGMVMGRWIEPTIIAPEYGAKKLFTFIDPYRQQHTYQRHFLYKDFPVNGVEKIVIDEIKPKEYCNLYLYLKQNKNSKS